MTPSLILGLFGDFLTFGGGIVLSLDALQRTKDFQKVTALQKAVNRFRDIKLTVNGLSVFDDNSTELVFIRKSVGKAMWGTVIITIGFLCLLTSKIIEIANA